MRFNECKCGSTNFEITRNGKMECVKCGKWFSPFSAEHNKVIKANGKHYFWVIATPHFLDRFETKLPNLDTEDYLDACLKIEKKATMLPSSSARYPLGKQKRHSIQCALDFFQ